MIVLQTLNLSIGGFWLLIAFLVIGGVFGWNAGVRSQVSLSLYGVIAYLLFIGGGNAVLEFLNRLIGVIPALLNALTGQNISGFPQLAINVELSLLARVLGFAFIGIVLPLVLDKMKWPGWQSPPGPPAHRYLGLITGVLLFALYTSALSSLTNLYILQGGNPPADFPIAEIGTAFAIMPNLGIWPLVMLVLLLGILFLLGLPKTWAK